MKPLNRQPFGDGTKHFAIKIEVLTLELEVFDALFRFFLVARVVLKTPHRTAARTSRDDVVIGLE